jgi:hypothetical protein
MDNDDGFCLYNTRRIGLYSNLGVTWYNVSTNDNVNQPRNSSKHSGIHCDKSWIRKVNLGWWTLARNSLMPPPSLQFFLRPRQGT